MTVRRKRTVAEIWSFFTGAAGLDLGLEKAGLAPTLSVEIDPVCCATLRRNRKTLDVWEEDIGELNAAALFERRGKPKDVFMMVGGPPCQSFCPGGKRAGLTDPRGNLIYTYLKLIDQVRPRYFLLENVGNLVTAALRHRPIADRPGKRWNLSSYHNAEKNGHSSAAPMTPDELSGSAVRQIFADAGQLGYSLNFALVNSAEFGAAQHRHRIILLGVREGRPPAIPEPTHGPMSDSQQPFKTLRDTIFDLRKKPGPHSEYTPEMAKYFAMVPPGGNWRQLPKELQREALGDAAYAAGGGKTGFFRRLSWDSPSPTITGRSNRKGSAICHPDYIRPLSVRESARLQGFPDDWFFEGSMSDQYMQVGNAVPLHIGAAVGRAIVDHAQSSPRKAASYEPDVEQMLHAAICKLRSTARNKRGRNDGQMTLFDDVSPELAT